MNEMSLVWNPPEKCGPCQYPQCEKDGVWNRQNTQYEHDESNWMCLCDEHQQANDEYWKDQWRQYYSDKL